MVGSGLRRGRRALSLVGAAFSTWALVGGAGLGSGSVAYATWDILPNVVQRIPNTVAGIAAQASSWDATIIAVGGSAAEAAAVGAAATVAVPGEIVAGGVLATGAALYGAWHLGGVIGRALPCLDCQSPSSLTYPYGMDQQFTIAYSAAGRVVSSWSSTPISCTSNSYCSAIAGHSASGYQMNAWTLNPANPNHPTTAERLRMSCVFTDGYAVSGGEVFSGSSTPMCPLSVTGHGTLAKIKITPDATSERAEVYPPDQAVPPQPTPQSTNADLVVRTTATCSGSGGTVSADSPTFHASDAVPPPMVIPACPSGTVRTSWQPKVHPLTDTTVPDTALTPPQTVPATVAGHTDWAPCLPSGASFPCVLTLSAILPDGTTRPYDPETDYRTDPAQQPDKEPSRWQCKWGTISLAVTECSGIYQQAPRTSAVPPVDAEEDSCHFKVTRPWTWPYQALKCAFVPPAGTFETDFGAVRAAWDASVFGVVEGAVSDVFFPFLHMNDGGATCAGPTINVPAAHLTNLQPWNACSGLMAWARGIVYPLATATIYIGGFILAARSISRAIGADVPLE
jgi:hypothetical protein